MSTASVVVPGKPITDDVAHFVHATRYEDIPAHVVQLGKKAILDSLGVALAGAKAEGSAIIRRHIEEMGCANGAATVFGTSLRAPSRFAALANGTAMHSDDYDDTYYPSRIHPSAAVAAALFADADAENRSAREVLTAFNVGVEVSCKVSEAIDGQHYQRGYHTTGTCGVFGAAAAVCNLRRLPAETIRAAFGIAASSATPGPLPRPASILVLRKAGLAEFTDEVVNRRDVQEVIGRIDYTTYSDDEAAAGNYGRLTTFLEIVLKDGRKIAARTDVARGSPLIPMTEEEVADKFRACAAFAGWPGERREKIITAVLHLERLARIADLTELLSSRGQEPGS